MTHKAAEKAKPFIRYPTNKLFAVINHLHDLEAVLDALADLGINSGDVETFCGEEGIKRIDAHGHEHNLRTQIIRTMQQLGQEGADVKRYEKELKAGHYLISVFVLEGELKSNVVNVLKTHNAHQINFYSPLSTEKI